MRTRDLTHDAALLLARASIGVVFAAHGLLKVSGGVDATAAGFDHLGVPLPALSAWFTTSVELVGGIALIVGLATRLVGALLVIDMAGAYVFAHAGNGIFVADGGAELVMALGATSLLLAAFGAGRFSLDHVVAPHVSPGRRTRRAKHGQRGARPAAVT